MKYMSTPVSFVAFQNFFQDRIQTNPDAHEYTEKDFHVAWEKAIQKRISDGSLSDAVLNGSDFIEIREEIYYHLMADRINQITHRPKAFNYFCQYYHISDEVISHEYFVQTWKEYVFLCENDPLLQEKDTLERECFIKDILDSNTRCGIHELLQDREFF